MRDKLHVFIEVISKILTILSKEQKRKSIGAFIALSITSLLELVGVTIIVPFMTAVMNPEKVLNNEYVLFVMEWFHIEKVDPDKLLLVLGLAIIVVYVIKNAALIWSRYIQSVYQVNLQKEISVMMMESYMNHPYEYFVNTNSAQILRGIDADVSGFANILNILFTSFAEFLTILLIMGFVLTADFVTSVGLMIIALFCILVTVFGTKNIMTKTGIKYRDTVAKRYQCACQTVNGIKEIFVMQKRGFFLRTYEKTYKEYVKVVKIYQLVTSLPERLIEIMIVGGIVVIICVRIMLGYAAAEYVPQLAALALACFRLLPSLNKIADGASQLIYNKPCLDAVYANIDEARKFVCENGDTERIISDERTEHLSFDEEIAIEGITWRYLNGDRNILEQVSLKIKKGESIAVIGESGAGKSTLADIIMGLLRPQCGRVLVDGKPIESNYFEWAQMIGYVPQSVYLIDDTIRNNVAFGIPQEEIDDKEVWHALKQAKMDEYISKLPQGLDTIVGERGIKFSGGQRQRIAIARAMYYDPEIFVLDEATSALDNETEEAVMESIDWLHGRKTLIIIAHRLSTIQKCDKVYEVVDGKIVENRQKLTHGQQQR